MEAFGLELNNEYIERFPIAKDNPNKNKRVICPSCGKSNYKPRKSDKCFHCGEPFEVER